MHPLLINSSEIVICVLEIGSFERGRQSSASCCAAVGSLQCGCPKSSFGVDEGVSVPRIWSVVGEFGFPPYSCWLWGDKQQCEHVHLLNYSHRVYWIYLLSGRLGRKSSEWGSKVVVKFWWNWYVPCEFESLLFWLSALVNFEPQWGHTVGRECVSPTCSLRVLWNVGFVGSCSQAGSSGDEPRWWCPLLLLLCMDIQAASSLSWMRPELRHNCFGVSLSCSWLWDRPFIV